MGNNYMDKDKVVVKSWYGSSSGPQVGQSVNTANAPTPHYAPPPAPTWDHEKLNIRQMCINYAKDIYCNSDTQKDILEIAKEIEAYFWECKLP